MAYVSRQSHMVYDGAWPVDEMDTARAFLIRWMTATTLLENRNLWPRPTGSNPTGPNFHPPFLMNLCGDWTVRRSPRGEDRSMIQD